MVRHGVRSGSLPSKLIERLHHRADADRWGVSPARLAEALEQGVAKALGDRARDARELERYLSSLHVADLALACACADGREEAWDHFVLTHRPVLYRSADALDPAGGAREVADALYAELFGLHERDGRRQSLFRYYHGRSSLATWLRAVLSQRFVDRLRADRRLEPLAENDEQVEAAGRREPPPDPDRARYLTLVSGALAAAIGRLADRDRLRLSLYYAQQLTLAQTGRALGEHEATVSRQLARTRSIIRKDVERQMKDAGLQEPEVARLFQAVAEDAGPLELGVWFENAKPASRDAPTVLGKRNPIE